MKNNERLPSQARLWELLDLDQVTGALTWRERPDDPGFNWRAGRPALTAIDNHGYRHGKLLGCWAFAHRVIWKMVYGGEPEYVSHIDGDTLFNRPSNLHATDATGVARNAKLKCHNTSGVNGVGWSPGENCWRASITIDNRTRHLGYFALLSAAVAARAKAEREHGGFSARHGEKRDD